MGSKKHSFCDTNESRKYVLIIRIIEIILLFALAAFSLFKACENGYLFINILFHNAVINIIVSALFALFSIYRIITLTKLSKRDSINRMVVIIICLLVCLFLIYIVAGNIYSSFYTTIHDEIDAITVTDVFGQIEGNVVYNAEQIRLWYPFVNISASEVQQSVDLKDKNYFYSLEIKSSKRNLIKIKDELIRYLHTEYTLNCTDTNHNVISGNFIDNAHTYNFIIQVEQDYMCCVIYRGEDLCARKITYPVLS